MTNDVREERDDNSAKNELEQVIQCARQAGAIIRTKRLCSASPITHVQVRSGIPGVGPHWMPAVAAVERLRVFLADRAQSPPPLCGGCNKPLLPQNAWMSDGCPCNSERGVNHGLVAASVCTCDQCESAQAGSARNPERFYQATGELMVKASEYDRLAAEVERRRGQIQGLGVMCGFPIVEDVDQLAETIGKVIRRRVDAQNQLDSIVCCLQRRLQPEGSPPLGNKEVLARWIVNEAALELTALRQQLRDAKAAMEGALRCLRKCDEYLSMSRNGRIGSGSRLHDDMKDQIRELTAFETGVSHGHNE